MHELEFDEAESAELLELIEGEGSCALSYDAIGRLYDELTDRKQGRGCLWRLTEPERMEIARELEECAETIELSGSTVSCAGWETSRRRKAHRRPSERREVEVARGS